MLAGSPLIGLEQRGLQWHSHLKDCPIAEACKGDNHITPEEQNVRSFRKFQITEQYEKGGLHEEQQSHFNQVAGESHKSDGQCEEAKNAEHAIQEKIPLSYVYTSTDFYTSLYPLPQHV